LWTFLHSLGHTEVELQTLWSQVEDVILRSLLATLVSARKEAQQARKGSQRTSSYNNYKLIGYDLLLDSKMNVHLIEANARPALLNDSLDKAVNRPMVIKI